MSWDDDHEEQYPCPCGKGTYSEYSSSDDWGRTRSSWAMNCLDCKSRFQLYEYFYHKNGMTETGRRWVGKESFDRAEQLKQQAAHLGASALSGARERYLRPLVDKLSGLSKKGQWEAIRSEFPHFEAIGTFYRRTKGVPPNEYLRSLFHDEGIPGVLRLLEVSDDGLLNMIRELDQLKADAEVLLRRG